MKTKSIILAGALLSLTSVATSCSDMLDTDSSNVVFAGDKITDPNDTVYSVLGILNKIQIVADRSRIVGDVMGDLIQITDHASTDLLNLSNFNFSAENKYNRPQDYYAIINNCNYYLAMADTSVTKYNKPVFAKEIALVKSYRAWTYLELAKMYGSFDEALIPFVTTPILKESEANPNLYPKKTIPELCDYLAKDIEPNVDVEYPQYGAVGAIKISDSFIPVRQLLGDLNLWAGNYQAAAHYYYQYLAPLSGNYIFPSAAVAGKWNDKNYDLMSFSTMLSSSQDQYAFSIPMDKYSIYDAVISEVYGLYNSCEKNFYYVQLTPADAYKALSAEQTQVNIFTNDKGTRDTIYAPRTFNGVLADAVGDLRYRAAFSKSEKSFVKDGYNKEYQQVNGLGGSTVSGDDVVLKAISMSPVNLTYLHLAEALNHLGCPQAAFCILKYGLCNETIAAFVSEEEQAKLGELAVWPKEFKSIMYESTGRLSPIHSYGCGACYVDSTYTIDGKYNAEQDKWVKTSLATLDDSIAAVDVLINNEQALSNPYDGQRFFELKRMAHYPMNGDKFLIDRIAKRSAEVAAKLSNKTNWRLPFAN